MCSCVLCDVSGLTRLRIGAARRGRGGEMHDFSEPQDLERTKVRRRLVDGDDVGVFGVEVEQALVVGEL